MTVNELIKRLSSLPGTAQVMILDSFNGGGAPRTINYGPQKRVVTKSDANDAADCEDIIGKTVIVMGYGCY